MAMYDWNNDGKRELHDDFFEYNYIYNNSDGKSSYTLSNGISTFGAIISMIGGLFLAVFIIALFAGNNAENVPVIITIILWIICASILAVFCDEKNI